jgi:ankyrin repeat protein
MELIKPVSSRTRLKFLYDLLGIGLLSGEEVVAILDASQPLAILWFAPELELFGHFRCESQLREHNWRRHRMLAALSANPSPLAEILRNDDLQALIAENLSDLDQTVATFPFETYDLLAHPVRLIQYSAFYDSINCFTYLVSQQVNMENLVQFAAAGVGEKVVEFALKNEHFDPADVSELACLHHKNVLLEWVITEYSLELSEDFLICSVLSDNLNAVFELANPGIDCNTALIQAAKSNQLDSLQLLLSFEWVDRNSTDDTGRNSMFYVAQQGNIEMARMLDSIDLSVRDHNGDSVLLVAVHSQQIDVVSFLLGRPGVDVNSRNLQGDFPLIEAVRRSNEPIVKLLCQDDFIELNQCDATNCTPLCMAARNSDHSICALLTFYSQTNSNLATNQGVTPLLGAAYSGSCEIVYLLLGTMGIEITVADNSGITLLMAAAIGGNPEMVDRLLADFALDYNAQDKRGDTVLIHAVRVDSPEIVEILIGRADLRVNTVNGQGKSALMVACELGLSEIVELLCERGDIDFDLVDVHFALRMTSLLCEWSSFLSKTTCMMLAALNKHDQITFYIARRKAMTAPVFGFFPPRWNDPAELI